MDIFIRRVGKRSRRTAIAIVAAYSLIHSGGAIADAANPKDGDAPQTLDEVVVTAQKRSERAVDVPISITAATATQLENAGILGFQDIDQIAVNTKMDRTGIYFTPSIRGISSQVIGVGDENNVAVYIDGFYQPSQVAINSDFNNVKDVQVLKGPQGTLFGRNATGGAILIETLDPSFTPVARASASFGRFNEAIEQVYFSNGITDNLAFDIALYAKNTDGYIRDIRGFDTSPTNDRDIRSKLVFKPSDALKMTGALEYSRVQDATGIAYTYADRSLAGFIDPATPIATGINRTSLNFGPISWTETTAGSLKTEYDFGGPKLTSYTRYERELGFINFDVDGSQLPIFQEHIWSGLNNATQEFDFGESSGRLDWVTGLFFSSTSARYINIQALVNPVGNVFGPGTNERTWTTSAAAFADATYHFDNGISVTGGIRESWEKRTFAYSEPPETAIVDHAHKAWDAATPRVVVRYGITPDSNVYASFSKGFKSGTFNSGQPDPVPASPETVKAYEVGYKLAHGPLQFSTAVYYYDYRDLQVAAEFFNDGHYEATLSNAARAKIYGLESQLSAAVSRDITFSSGFAYNHARYTKYTNASIYPTAPGTALNSSTAAVQDWSGLRMIGAPDWTGNLGFQWTHPTPIGKFGIAGNIYASSRYTPTIDDQLNGAYRYEQAGYATVSLNASFAPTRHWKFTLWSRNLTDREIRIVSGGNPFGDYNIYGEPRTYGGRVDYTFE